MSDPSAKPSLSVRLPPLLQHAMRLAQDGESVVVVLLTHADIARYAAQLLPHPRIQYLTLAQLKYGGLRGRPDTTHVLYDARIPKTQHELGFNPELD
jgi:hypothetical protein